ncbi:MAG: BrnA antitoxin family protein [Pseudomonadota bacterium]
MKKEYDFSAMKSRKNPYASKLKKQVTIRMSDDVVSYFKSMSDETGIPYQSLINLYLRDCVAHDRKPDLSWRSVPQQGAPADVSASASPGRKRG